MQVINIYKKKNDNSIIMFYNIIAFALVTLKIIKIDKKEYVCIIDTCIFKKKKKIFILYIKLINNKLLFIIKKKK